MRRVMFLRTTCCWCLLLLGQVRAQSTLLIKSPTVVADRWSDLDEFLRSRFTYDSAGNVVAKSVVGREQWVTEVSGLDGDGVLFEVQSKPGADRRYNAELKVWCHRGEGTNVIVSTGHLMDNIPYGSLDGLVPDSERLVITRLDHEIPQIEQWVVGLNSDLYSPNTYLHEMLEGKVFYFEFRPPSEDHSITLAFPIAGLKQYRKQIEENCGLDW